MIPLNRTLFITLIAIPVVVIAASLLIIGIILSSSRSYLFDSAADAPKAEAALILGAGVLKNGGLSPVLQDRVDQAIELYKVGRWRR